MSDNFTMIFYNSQDFRKFKQKQVQQEEKYNDILEYIEILLIQYFSNQDLLIKGYLKTKIINIIPQLNQDQLIQLIEKISPEFLVEVLNHLNDCNKEKVIQLFNKYECHDYMGYLQIMIKKNLISEDLFHKPIIKDLLLIDTKQSAQFIDLIMKSSKKDYFIHQVVIGDIKLNSSLVSIFISNLNSNADQSIYYYLINQANSLDKKIRLQAIKALAYHIDKPLIPLITKESDTINKQSVILSSLEDQYADIRISAIRTITNLSVNPQFKEESKDLLKYMLNDQKDEVRIAAINAIRQIHKDFILNKSDIDTLLFNLQEKNLELRMAFYQLIAASQCDSSQNLFLLVDTICNENSKQFSEDFDFIASSFNRFSKLNASKIEEQQLSLLGDSQRESQEPFWDNPEYILRVVLIKNSGIDLINMPFYFIKHCDILMDKYPQFFGSIRQDWLAKVQTKLNKINSYLKKIINSVGLSYQNFLIIKLYQLIKNLKTKIKFNETKYQLDQIVMHLLILLYEQMDDEQENLNHLIKFVNKQLSQKLTLGDDKEEFFNGLKLKIHDQMFDKFEQVNLREFQIIKPKNGDILRRQNFKLIGQTKNLKEPINQNYVIKIEYQGESNEYHRIQNIELNQDLLEIDLNLKNLRNICWRQRIQVQYVQYFNFLEILNLLPSKFLSQSWTKVMLEKQFKVGKSIQVIVQFK